MLLLQPAAGFIGLRLVFISLQLLYQPSVVFLACGVLSTFG
jgi:hypothetical protein